jgi:uracil phosphoribosyltransferase
LAWSKVNPTLQPYTNRKPKKKKTNLIRSISHTAIQTLLPHPVPINHLGLFREPTTLQPVEYYNNLPYSQSPQSPIHASATTTATTTTTTTTTVGTNSAAATLAILLDPVIATGGTSEAAIQTLREWGVQRVLVISVLGSEPGLRRAAEEWAEGTELWVGAVDQEVDKRGMIKPGIGDVGDRLFLTLGK